MRITTKPAAALARTGLFRALVAGAASSVLAAGAAGAQTRIQGTANGCFTTSTCSPTQSTSYQSGVSLFGNLLTYSNSVIDTRSIGSNASLGGTPVANGLNTNNFGSFTLGSLSSGSQAFDGQLFTLLLSFSRPGAGTTTTFVAPLTGSVVASDAFVRIDFGGNGFGSGASQVVNLNGGGSFRVTVQDVTLSANSTNDIKGEITEITGPFSPAEVVPEPSTVLLLATGFLGLAAVGYRKRRS